MRLSVACARAGEREALLDARDRPTVRVSRAAVDALTRGTHAGRRSAVPSPSSDEMTWPSAPGEWRDEMKTSSLLCDAIALRGPAANAGAKVTTRVL